MLHAASPFDDPTRAYRAVRFALRLGFRIEPRTRGWIREAIAGGSFGRLSGDRLRRELLLLFREQPPPRVVRALAPLGLAEVVDPSLSASPAACRRLERFASLARRRSESGEREWAALLAWTLDLPAIGRAAAARRLGLSGAAEREFVAIEGRVREARGTARSSRTSDLAALVRDWPSTTILAVASDLSAENAAKLLRARSVAGRVRLTISGDDLRRSGVEPGPAIGRALDKTWRARVDRRIASSEELPFALAQAAVGENGQQ
jgi:tRNA nucleotidyltransferase (CCA-adding enzyme)